MKLIDSFKKQSRAIQILEVIFIIAFIYETILSIMHMQHNGAITTLMGFILCVIIVKYLILDK